ncbi:AAA family ATPase [Desulfosporosinus sp. OT]|uniref:AAA family ATPase n=1 Tax=Desulfosporosinus sp. OT TaxID=913865 RepID=UPI001FA6F27F|nr:AAA family ATPase [Desulfosporosinus sp. OT]
MRNFKGQMESQKLTGKDIFVGPNGKGKTTRLQAIGIALLGYVPGKGKLPAETFKLASADTMSVGLVTDDLTFTRTYTRSEKSGKDGSNNITVSQGIDLSPSRGEKKAADKEARIAVEVGNFPVMLDFNEFLSLSDAKRRDFIYGLSAIKTDLWDRTKVESHIRSKLLTLDLEVNNPDQYKIMSGLIADAMKEYPENDDIQAGLQSMIEWSKAKQTHWNDEKKNAVGAVKKLADMKNQLAETDRNIVQHKAELEQLQQQLIDSESQLAKDRERKRAIDQRLVKISELGIMIETLTKSQSEPAAVNYDSMIADRQGKIKQQDFKAEFVRLDQELQSLSNQLKEAREQERAAYDALSTTKAEKSMLESTLKQIDEQSKKNGTARVCVIHPKIGCDKDFSKAATVFSQQLVALEQKEVYQQSALKEVRARIEVLEENKANIDAQRTETHKKQTDLNQANEEIRKSIAGLEKKKADEVNAAARISDQLKMYKEELTRLRNLPTEVIAPLDILEKQSEGRRTQIKELKVKLEGQEKAKITLSSLKSTMIDSKTATYNAQCVKDLAEALGPKGLQGELVKGILEPIRSDIQTNLKLIGLHNDFYFSTESDTGKEVFQFGWENEIGDKRNFDALSTGQQLLLLIAMLVTFLERSNPPLKVLAIDNIENLDRVNFRKALAGMDKLSGKIDNIILSGVVDLYETKWIDGEEVRTLLPELNGWGVTDLGEIAFEEVEQSA